MKIPRSLVCVGAAALVAASSLKTQAAPYASGVTNNSGTIQSYLNAAPAAGALTVTTYPSGAHPVLTPSTPIQGLNSFPLGADTSYSISVSNHGTGLATQQAIASANQANTNYSAPNPRGLAVNTSPTNGALFGTVYVAVAGAGGGKNVGMFGFNSDFSFAFGLNNSAYTSTLDRRRRPLSSQCKQVTDGSVWVSDYAGGDSDEWHVSIRPYLRSSVPPFMVFNTAGYAGVGSGVYSHIYAPVANGSIANGNLVLYAYDYDLEADSTNILGGTDGAVGFGASAFNTQWEAGSGGQDGTITVAGEILAHFVGR